MYIIVEEPDSQALVDTVNDYVMQGFVPTGGLAVKDGLLIQPMFNAQTPPKVAWVKPKAWIPFEKFVVQKDESEINKYNVEYVFKNEHFKREIVGDFDSVDDIRKTLELEANAEKSTR